jgi:very-short-patch-repair endonuclease
MRTLLDLAEVLPADVPEVGLDRLWRRRLVHPRRLAEYRAGPWCMCRRGTATLRRLAAERCHERASGSDVETRPLQLIRDARLPPPARQHEVMTRSGVRYLDLAYPEHRLAIEVDGMESRLDPTVFLDERVRQNLIEAQGWTFRRFGHAHVTNDALWTIFTVAEALGLRPIRWTRG